MIDKASFREGMSRLGAAVTIIATDGPAGRHGFTASAVCSVTDTPPTLLVCMNRSVSSHDAVLTNRLLSVNVLTGAHEVLSNRFADKSIAMLERFGEIGWSRGANGAPLLTGATVAFDCTITEVTEVGTHSVLFCRVDDVVLAEDSPDALLWFGRSYHRLPLRA